MYPVSYESQFKFRPDWDLRNWLLILCLITLLFAVIHTATQLRGIDHNSFGKGKGERGKGETREIPSPLKPRFARILQPLVQITASVLAMALFFVILLALAKQVGGLQLGFIVLIMLGTMWYVLFNVMAGTQSIPSDLFEATRVYKLSRWQCWKSVRLPGIFPDLFTGMITALGGAITMPVLPANTST